MRREFGIDMRLAGALWSKLDQIVVAFHERDHAHQVQEFGAVAEQIRVESDRLHQQVDPLPRGELRAHGQIVFAVIMRHLHGHEPMQTPRHLVAVAGIGVYQRAHAPDARDQQLGILVHRNGIDNHATDAKILECGLVTVEFFVKRDLYLVDNLVSAFLANLRLDEVRFLAMNVIVRKNVANALHAGIDALLVGGGRVFAQQVFQHIRRHQRIAFDFADQILAHRVLREVIGDLAVQIAHYESRHAALSTSTSTSTSTSQRPAHLIGFICHNPTLRPISFRRRHIRQRHIQLQKSNPSSVNKPRLSRYSAFTSS